MDEEQQTAASTLILGIGNTLLSDEGVGVHALEYFAAHYPHLDDVELMDGGTLSFTLAGPIEDCTHLVVIDAAQLQAAPGTVRLFEDAEMDRFVGGNKKSSVHEVGLVDLMTVARLADRLPARRALVGIQPHTLGWGVRPSPAVEEAIPQACAMAAALIERWRQ